MTKTKIHIVFDSPRPWHAWVIKFYLKQGYHVSIIEPFYAYHHQKGFRFFPKSLPANIQGMIDRGKVNLVSAENFDPRATFRLASDRAVEEIESLYPVFRPCHRAAIDFICEQTRSLEIEDAFRKTLSDHLAEFYSMNMMFKRVAEIFSSDIVKVYTDGNGKEYLKIRELLHRLGRKIEEGPNFRFSRIMMLESSLRTLKKNTFDLLMLTGQTFLSGIGSLLKQKSHRPKQKYTYGIAVISPTRQLVGNRRGPDFLIDEDKIKSSEVVYFPLIKMNKSQNENLKQLKGDICFLSVHRWENFSHFGQWLRLLFISFVHESFQPLSVIAETAKLLYEYNRWENILAKIEMKHFITHCDFGSLRIARNIALNQAQVKTWYFTDSMNFGFNFVDDVHQDMFRMPGWSYLHYDHFVTWDEAIKNYFQLHPKSFRHFHVVGCLWTQHLKATALPDRKASLTKFKIAIFDTTYCPGNYYTAFEEGIRFAQDIIRLGTDFPDVEILFKEKKTRPFLCQLDPVQGRTLRNLYDQMDRIPSIVIKGLNADPATIMSESDMVISFPFTSTTFEAMSIHKRAIWHDPLGKYRRTPYGKISQVTTHDYEELRALIERVKVGKEDLNPFFPNSPLIDPYRDGRAVERFQTLLKETVN